MYTSHKFYTVGSHHVFSLLIVCTGFFIVAYISFVLLIAYLGENLSLLPNILDYL
jgi:uncharacterized membrane protein (DUF485 family)